VQLIKHEVARADVVVATQQRWRPAVFRRWHNPVAKKVWFLLIVAFVTWPLLDWGRKPSYWCSRFFRAMTKISANLQQYC